MKDSPARPSFRALGRRDDDAERVTSVLGSITRSGSWEPPEVMRALSVLGHIVLDYRDAELPPGVTMLTCDVLLGSVEVLVPPEVDVELSGSVVLGSVETKDDLDRLEAPPHLAERLAERDVAGDDEPERPLLCIECRGALGSVEVKLP